MHQVIAALLILTFDASICDASPGTDLEQGNGIVIDHLRFSMNGSTTGSGTLEVPKPAGSLDFVLSARDFGLDADVLVHLHGTRDGDHIAWTFSEHFASAIALAWPNWLDGIEGSLNLDAEFAAGHTSRMWSGRVRPFDVQLKNGAGSRIRAHVHGPFSSWTWDATAIDIAGAGGLGPAALSAAWVDGRGLCERSTEQLAAIEVTMASEVGGTGALVRFASSDAAHVIVPPVLVAPGTSGATVAVRIAAGWHGRSTVTASYGSVQIPITVEVKEAQQCESPGLSLGMKIKIRELALPKIFGQCPACGTVLGFDQFENVVIADKQQRLYAIGPDQKEHTIAPDFGRRMSALLAAATPARTVSGKPRGAVAARLTASWQRIPASLADDRFMPVRRKTKTAPLQPIALNRFGVGVAFAPADKGLSQAVGIHGALEWPIGPPLGWKEVAGVDDHGALAGTADLGKGARAVVVANGKVMDLGTLGGATSQVLAVNGAGDVVGVADTADGHSHGFIARDGKLADLGVLAGDLRSAAVAVNRAGWVVANSFDAKGTAHPFLVSPRGKQVAVTQLALPAGVTLAEGLAINDDGSLVARGKQAGQEKLFVVSARGGK